MIDSLFVPINCILHSTAMGNYIRENRKVFLHKGAFHKFKGYAYSQIHKLKTKVPLRASNRYENFVKYGYDVKFAYHVIRLLDECAQILNTGDLDLQRNKEQLKSIRRGEWSFSEVIEYFTTHEKQLEKDYVNSKLPYNADMESIKLILINCLEMHYGSIEKMMNNTSSKSEQILNEIRELVK